MQTIRKKKKRKNLCSVQSWCFWFDDYLPSKCQRLNPWTVWVTRRNIYDFSIRLFDSLWRDGSRFWLQPHPHHHHTETLKIIGFFTSLSSLLIWTILEARIAYSIGFMFLTCGLISCKTDILVNSPHFNTSWQRVQLRPSVKFRYMYAN